MDRKGNGKVNDLHKYAPTPAPWRVAKLDARLVVDDKGEEIADCSSRYLERPQRCIANARLIAAAPDLLAACKMALHADGSGKGFPFAVAVRAAQKAIAKAEGAE